jgi:hypothetical protein
MQGVGIQLYIFTFAEVDRSISYFIPIFCLMCVFRARLTRFSPSLDYMIQVILAVKPVGTDAIG